MPAARVERARKFTRLWRILRSRCGRYRWVIERRPVNAGIKRRSLLGRSEWLSAGERQGQRFELCDALIHAVQVCISAALCLGERVNVLGDAQRLVVELSRFHEVMEVPREVRGWIEQRYRRQGPLSAVGTQGQDVALDELEDAKGKTRVYARQQLS
ncbi:MAG: hypothetical protein RL033_5799, partial [Pseudomonadota bacterium]